MEMDTFTSPLSFYEVETNYGYDALSVLPEEHGSDPHAHEPSPLPYFEDGSAATIHHHIDFML